MKMKSPFRQAPVLLLLSSAVSILSSSQAQDVLVDIPTTASATPGLDAFVEAVSETRLATDLAGASGSFTVFAPTDNAIAALPEGLWNCLFLPQYRQHLDLILRYHVVGRTISSEALSNGQTAKTLMNGTDRLRFGVTSTGGITVNGVDVVQPDVLASNGVIHVIDEVLIPPTANVNVILSICPISSIGSTSKPVTAPAPAPVPDRAEPVPTLPPSMVNLVQKAAATEGLETFVEALTKTNVAATLSDSSQSFTVMAPNDAAFAALPEGLLDCLLLPQKVQTLQLVLLNHVLGRSIPSANLSTGLSVKTLMNFTTRLSFNTTNGLKVNGVDIVQTDLLASNGIIHVIDEVLIPKSLNVDAFLATCTRAPVPAPTTTVPDRVLPPPPTTTPSVIDIILADPQLTSFVDVLAELNLLDILNQNDLEYTVLAPTNNAFADIVDVLPTLNKDELLNIVLYHVLPNITLRRAQFQTGFYDSLSNVPLPCSVSSSRFIRIPLIFVGANGARVLRGEQIGSNGVVHKLDKVMIPS